MVGARYAVVDWLAMAVLAGTALTGTVACGGKSSEGGTGTTVDTGLPPETALTDLNPEQVTQFCEAALAATTDYFDNLFSLEALCTQYGISVGLQTSVTDDGLQSSCATTRMNCLANPPQTVLDRQAMAPQVDSAECMSFPMLSAACMATVGQYEQCASAAYAESDRLLAPLSSCNTTRAAVEAAVNESQSGSVSASLQARPDCAALDPCDADAMITMMAPTAP